jgi:hypothetical protein
MAATIEELLEAMFSMLYEGVSIDSPKLVVSE